MEVATGAAEEEGLDPVHGSRFHRGTILLVEDSSDEVELTLRALKKVGLADRVVAVQNGAEALDYLLERVAGARWTEPLPSLVLLDLKLPLVDGLELLEQIKSRPALRELPVVMLSSSRHEGDVARAYRLGVNSYIVKPTDFSEFVNVVNNLASYWFGTVELPPQNYWSA